MFSQLYAEREKALKATEATPKPSNVSSVSEWLKVHSRPAEEFGPAGFKSSFVTSPKIYGGNTMFSSFKSAAVTLKKGKLLD